MPKSIAMQLTYPERVTKFNLKYLRKLVENGADVHPGARYVIKNDGTSYDLEASSRGSVKIRSKCRAT